MLLQETEIDPVMYAIGILIGTIIVALILYLAVMIIESQNRAKDKIAMIIIIALITVVVLPIIMNAIGVVFGELGDALASIRDAIDEEGRNYLVYMIPIFGFLILLAINKFLLDISWESAVWISLIVLISLFIMFCLLHEIADNFVENPLV